MTFDSIESTISDFVNDLMIKAVKAAGRVPDELSFCAEYDIAVAVEKLSGAIVNALNEGGQAI